MVNKCYKSFFSFSGIKRDDWTDSCVLARRMHIFHLTSCKSKVSVWSTLGSECLQVCSREHPASTRCLVCWLVVHSGTLSCTASDYLSFCFLPVSNLSAHSDLWPPDIHRAFSSTRLLFAVNFLFLFMGPFWRNSSRATHRNSSLRHSDAHVELQQVAFSSLTVLTGCLVIGWLGVYLYKPLVILPWNTQFALFTNVSAQLYTFTQAWI